MRGCVNSRERLFFSLFLSLCYAHQSWSSDHDLTAVKIARPSASSRRTVFSRDDLSEMSGARGSFFAIRILRGFDPSLRFSRYGINDRYFRGHVGVPPGTPRRMSGGKKMRLPWFHLRARRLCNPLGRRMNREITFACARNFHFASNFTCKMRIRKIDFASVFATQK